MKLFEKFILVFLFSAILIGCATTISIQESYLKPLLKKESIKKMTTYADEEKKLIGKADRLLNKIFESVTDKKVIPPSGDKHDYISRAIYYWPDPNDKNKKWIFKDGIVNRKSLEETDHFTFFEAMGAIRDLSLAYHLSSTEDYAKKAFQIIDQWFVNNKTKMNPNFNFAQAIPGKSDGTHWGIISARAIVWVISSIEFLEPSHSFNNQINIEFKNWCSNYLEWLTDSEFGISESKNKNNHGTFYDLQVAELADFTGDYDLCNSVLNRVIDTRVFDQIKSDGSMPAELIRTRPIHYSLFNLSAFFHVAMLGDKYNLNIWNAKSGRSGSIMDAFDFILAEIERVKTKENVEVNYSYVAGLLNIANTKFMGLYEPQLNKVLSKNKKLRLVDNYFIF